MNTVPGLKEFVCGLSIILNRAELLRQSHEHSAATPTPTKKKKKKEKEKKRKNERKRLCVWLCPKKAGLEGRVMNVLLEPNKFNPELSRQSPQHACTTSPHRTTSL